MTKSKIMISNKNFNYFKLLFRSLLFVFICIINKPSKSEELRLIQDAEIENTLLDWILPIYKEARLSPSSVKIYLVNDNKINAFVSGGQNIFIHTGLILNSVDPNAIIGVMAHEIGHIAGGHLIRTELALEKAAKGTLVGTIITAGLLVVDQITNIEVDGAAEFGTLGPSIAQRSFFKHTRENEKTADIAAIKYMNAINRPIEPLVNLLKILQKKELLHEDRQDPYIRTHPFIKDRINTLKSNTKIDKRNITKYKKEKLQLDRMIAKIIAFTQPPGKTLLLYPDEDKSLVNGYARAIAYLRMPDLKKGLREINILIDNNPNDPYFPELLGQMLFENGEIDKAIDALKLSSSLLPNDPIIMLALANAQIEANKSNLTIDARKNLREILKTNPNKIFAWRLLSIAEARLGNHGNANLAAAEEAYRVGKNNLAISFAEKARKIYRKGTPNDLRAQDIIFFSKERIK